MGIRYINKFRKRSYLAESYFCKVLGVRPLPFIFILERSKELNNAKFKSELWFMDLLRTIQLKIDCKRNFPILNRFFADFYFHRIGLVVEIDGKSHNESKEYDNKRDELFRKRSLTVVRIKYGDLNKASHVINKIIDSHTNKNSLHNKKVCRNFKKSKANLKNEILSKEKRNYWYLRNKKVQENMSKMMLNALKK